MNLFYARAPGPLLCHAFHIKEIITAMKHNLAIPYTESNNRTLNACSTIFDITQAWTEANAV
jgi:hypothetical protein